MYVITTVLFYSHEAPDNKEELFVGCTDRVVNVYRWSTGKKSLQLKSSFNFEGQVCMYYWGYTAI